MERIETVAYKLHLPAMARIHTVFYVSILKKAIGGNIKVQPLHSILDKNMIWNVQPENVLQYRPIAHGLDILIKWHQLPEFESTWEPLSTIRRQFPHFKLEDEVVLQGAGIDRLLQNGHIPRKRRSHKITTVMPPESSSTSLERSIDATDQ